MIFLGFLRLLPRGRGKRLLGKRDASASPRPGQQSDQHVAAHESTHPNRSARQLRATTLLISAGLVLRICRILTIVRMALIRHQRAYLLSASRGAVSATEAKV